MSKAYFVRTCKGICCDWFSEFTADRVPVTSYTVSNAMQFDNPGMAVMIAAELIMLTGEEWEVISIEDLHEENQRINARLREIMEGDAK